MEDENNGYSRDEIFEQLRKIAEEEERLYGRQMAFDFDLKAESEPTEKSGVGNSQESIDAQPEVDFESLIDGSENPVESRKLWHGTQALILANVAKGKRRKFALDEKNLFLRASANTTDGKFTFLRANKTAYDLVEQWVRSNADEIELGMAYWDLNERNGFHSKKVAKSFNQILKAAMSVPPPKKDKRSKDGDNDQEPELEPVM